MNYKMNNNKVLITGASGGIGRSLCKKFIESNAIIICTSSDNEKLKNLTRGNQNINKESLHKFIKLLNLTKEDKNYLLNLTPQNYIGKASLLAKKV